MHSPRPAPALAPPDHDAGDGQNGRRNSRQTDDDPPGQAGDPSGMQWKLELQRDVANTSFARDLTRDEFAADGVEGRPGEADQTVSVRAEIRDVESALAVIVNAGDDMAGTECVGERPRRFQNLIE